MKLVDAIHKLYAMLAGSNKINAHRLLNQQRQLLYNGIEVQSEVIDVCFIERGPGRFQTIRLWIKLKKKDGSFMYTHTKALVSLNSIPQKGQLLRIKYFPENLSCILVL